MSAKNPTLEELKRQQYAQATNVLAQNAANKALAGTAKTTASGDHDGRGGKGQPTVINKSIYQKSTGHAGSPSAAKLAELNGSKNPNIPVDQYTDGGWYKGNLDELNRKYEDLSNLYGFDRKFSYTPVSYTPMANVGGFAPSQEYLDAMAYTQSLLDKINTGKTSYSDRVDAMMDTIANRDKFSYDFNTDPLFQNALASAMTSGQTAMQDTMGQAAALTGGYGSSYATSAANQTYNQFVQDAYAQLPEYYKLALDAYTREGDELYNQLGMYRDADNTEYGRLTNAYGMNYQKAQDLYGQEYNNYWDTTNANIGIDQYNANLAMKVNDENYQRAKDAYNMSLKSSGASETGADATMENVGASSADYQKALSMYEDVVKKYGADSKQAMEQGANIADTFGLSEQQVYTMVNQGDAYFTPQAQLRESDETPWLRDQNGKPLSNSAASFVSWGTDSSGNKIYKNLETGATYTEEQLKNLKWDKYKK